MLGIEILDFSSSKIYLVVVKAECQNVIWFTLFKRILGVLMSINRWISFAKLCHFFKNRNILELSIKRSINGFNFFFEYLLFFFPKNNRVFILLNFLFHFFFWKNLFHPPPFNFEISFFNYIFIYIVLWNDVGYLG